MNFFFKLEILKLKFLFLCVHSCNIFFEVSSEDPRILFHEQNPSKLSARVLFKQALFCIGFSHEGMQPLHNPNLTERWASDSHPPQMFGILKENS